MTTALFLGEDISLSLELRVRGYRTRLAKNLATLNIFTAYTADQSTDVVACFAAIKQLAEHFNAGNSCLLGVLDADNLDFFTHIDHTALNTTGHNSTAT
ncbi:hypothetical protein LP7551_00335 [Roseibium album]|nr:hypothetical protein LP7551_00335 [Roseibium album]